MASIIPYRPGQPAVQGSQRYRLDVTSYGRWKGPRVATMTVPGTTAAGVQLAPWENLADGWIADNSLPGDTEGSKLRIPNVLPEHVQGIALFAVENGDSTHPMLLYSGRYTGAPGAPWFLPSAGDALTVFYRGNPSGLDGRGDWLQLNVRTGPLADDVLVSVHLVVDAAGVSTEELNAIKAQQVADEARIAALEARPAGSAVNLPDTGTQAQAESRTGTTPLLWTATRLYQAARAAVTKAFVAVLTGGWVRSIFESNEQLHVVHVRADGTTENVSIPLRGGLGGGGLTAAQARDAAGSLLSTLPEFEYDAQSATLTFTESAPTDITLDQLAAAARNTIQSKLDRPAVGTAIAQLVEAWARIGTGDRIPESRLPPKVDDFVDALTEGGFQDEGDTAAEDAFVRTTWSTTANPANASSGVFVSDYRNSPAHDDVYAVVRVPDSIAVDKDIRLVGSEDEVPDRVFSGETWTFIDDEPPFNYYSAGPFATAPVGLRVRVQRFRPFTLDGPKVGIPDWVTGAAPIPANKLVNAPTHSQALDRDAVDARIVALRPIPFTDADESKLDSLTPGGEPNPALATNAELDAGTVTARKGVTPKLLADWRGRYIPKPTAAQAGMVPTATATGTFALALAKSPPVAGRVIADPRTSLPVITPAADATNLHRFLSLNERLYFNFGDAWTELSLGKNTVDKDEERYPARTPVARSQYDGGIEFQTRNYRAPARDDQPLTMSPVGTQNAPSGSHGNANYGVSHASGDLPPGLHHVVFYPSTYPDPALRNKVYLDLFPKLAEFDPGAFSIKLEGEADSARQSLTLAQRTNTRGVDIGKLFDLPGKFRPTTDDGKAWVINMETGRGGEWFYLTDSSTRSEFIQLTALQPVLLAEADANFIGRVRDNDANDWDAGDVAGRWFTRSQIPRDWRIQFRLKIGTRTRLLYSEWIESNEFLDFPSVDWDRNLTSSATRIARQIIDYYGAPASDCTPDASCFQFNARGEDYSWIGMIGDYGAFRTQNPGYYVSGTKMEVWGKPF